MAKTNLEHVLVAIFFLTAFSASTTAQDCKQICREDYPQLQEDYETLQENYTSLQDKFEKLNTSYTNLSDKYNETLESKDRYQRLYRRYRDLYLNDSSNLTNRRVKEIYQDIDKINNSTINNRKEITKIGNKIEKLNIFGAIISLAIIGKLFGFAILEYGQSLIGQANLNLGGARDGRRKEKD
jgi:predicted RNase H-like nuclease (RuvC/YqgF family)